MTKRITNLSSKAAAVTMAGVILLSGAGAAQAQTSTASLEAQIQALLAQLAALKAQTGVSTTFTRDLTMGSTGSDVTALQNFLIGKGHVIPAGATGYFGTQTRTALAAYQAANGIAPAVGYFGPLTRTNVNATVTVTPTPTNPGGGSSNTGTLRGGEADLNSFDLQREDSSGAEGEEEVQVFTATFDVDDGDVRVERLEITAEATNGSLNSQPWRYFDRVVILADGKEIADKDVDSRNDWSESSDDVYRLTLTGLDYVVREGDEAEITVAFDISDSIDSADLSQQFEFSIKDRGIRAVDSEGIQQYTGRDNETVTFGFDAEENGDLSIRSSSDNPDNSILVADEDRESAEYEVFAFDLQNRDDVDSLITDLTIAVTDLDGVSASDVIRRATLEVGRDRFNGDVGASSITFDDMDLEIEADDEVTATLVIRLVRNAATTPIAFSVSDTDIDAEGVRSGNSAQVSGSARSDLHQIAYAGVAVEGVSTSQSSNTPGNDTSASYGVYTVRFEVTAVEEDAYIHASAASTTDAGVRYLVGGTGFSGTESSTLTSTATRDGDYYVVREGRTETFTATVVLNPDAAGTFDLRIVGVRFNDEDSLVGSTEYTLPNKSEFRTDPIYVAN